MEQKFSSLQEACVALLAHQKATHEEGGCPVCCHLIAEDGTVIHSNCNRVLSKVKEGQWRIVDPTAHGEMSIMYWYFANKDRLGLPEPHHLTIMTTLDPCIMCTSAILLGGFNVGTVSFDDYGGVNYARNGFDDFKFVPKIQKDLLERFGYYAVEGDPQREKYQYEAKNVHFNEGKIQRELEKEIADMFYKVIADIKQLHFVGCHLKHEQFKNPRDLSQKDELIMSLKNLDEHALTIQLTERVVIDGVATSSFEPNEQLKDLLSQLLSTTPGAKNALALIDPHGSLLLARADRFDISPIHSAIITAFREYGKLYFEQAAKAAKQGIPFEQTKAYFHLPSLHSCTVIFLKALSCDDVLSWQAIGVYTYALSIPMRAGGVVYIEDYLEEAIPVDKVIENFPPASTKKFVNFKPVLAQMTKKGKK